MVAIYFIYGLSFFTLGMAALLEARHATRLPLGAQLPWLAAFGLVHSLVEWLDLALLLNLPERPDLALAARSVLLPISAVLLVRFGVGLVKEAGPLPEWMGLAPVALLTPAGLIIGYALVVAMTEPPLSTAADIWSRYLLYFPGNLLAAFGFVRQARGLQSGRLRGARQLLFGAAAALAFNALVAGLITLPAPYGLAPWLNYETVQRLTGLPTQFWRMISGLAVAVCVVQAFSVLEAERRHQEADLAKQRALAQQELLAAQYDARRSAEEWTAALVGSSRRIANLEEVDCILLEVVAAAQRLLQADAAVLGLWNAGGEGLELKYFAAPDRVYIDLQPVTDRPILNFVRSGRTTAYLRNGSQGLGGWASTPLGLELRAAVIAPLLLEHRSLGMLWAGRKEVRPFTEVESAGLERLADQAVIALEHALMASQLQSLATIEERSRIAREMHDGLAQILGYLSLEMQTLDALVRQGETPAVLKELQDVRANIQLAQADVRENILSLRTTLSDQVDGIAALREYLAEFGVQTGIQAELQSELTGPLNLSPLAEVQLLRILQEALANVRKHAHASQVRVRAAQREGNLEITVSDDGLGFDAPAKARRFGLVTMRERAESVGGRLEVNSSPGEGTCVQAWLPLVNGQ